MPAPYTVLFGDCAGPWAEFPVATLDEARALLAKFTIPRQRHGKVFGKGSDGEHNGLTEDEREEIESWAR